MRYQYTSLAIEKALTEFFTATSDVFADCPQNRAVLRQAIENDYLVSTPQKISRMLAGSGRNI